MLIKIDYRIGNIIVVRETNTPFDLVVKINGVKATQKEGQENPRINYYIDIGLLPQNEKYAMDKVINNQKIIIGDISLDVLLKTFGSKREIIRKGE